MRRRASGRSGPRYTVRIESIAAGGDGVGHLPDGKVVFVPRTAPGDVVETRIERSGARWARGFPLSIVSPGPTRRPPPCPYAGECGGCALEHLEYDAQLTAKAAIVQDALDRIGKLEVDVPPVVASPRMERYRNRVSFALRRVGDRVVAGFRSWEHPDRIVDVDGQCLLFEPAIGAAWDRLRSVWGPGAVGLPQGRDLRLTLRATITGAVSLLVEHGSGEGDPARLLEEVEPLESVWIRLPDGSTRCIGGTAALEDEWEGVTIPLRGAAFTQVNREAAIQLEAYLDTLVETEAGARVIDGYAGVGLRARRFALRGAHGYAVELDPDAVDAGRALTAGLPVEWVAGRVEDVLPGILPADVAILNPPRAGLANEVPGALRENPPRRIVYVSCNPATLARDLHRLGDSHEIGSIRAFDLFPQTAHVETVVRLDRTDRTNRSP